MSPLMPPKSPRFSRQTIAFLKKAARQKRPDWLDRNREEYEKLLHSPLQSLARELKAQISPLAPGYHFPQKGIGRIRRSSLAMRERGGGPFKDWLAYSAARPRKSRFEHNPNLFFLIQADDPKDGVLVAGGLYMPSSRQLRALREAVAEDASAFEALFKDKEFKRCFKGGFSDEKISSRPPRGFDPNHPKIAWIKLQAFFVWKPYKLQEFTSPKFAQLVARDWKQILRLNELLDQALNPAARHRVKSATKRPPKDLSERLSDLGEARRQMDF